MILLTFLLHKKYILRIEKMRKYRAELDEQIKNRPQEAYNRINNDKRIEVPHDPCKYI
jgi:recombination DNA repair RAD52 pathway protein